MNLLRIASAVAALLPVVLIGPVPARAAAPALGEIYTALGVDTVPADHVVLVDVSGSLGATRYAALRKSLTGFFGSLAAEDFVTLIPYGGTATAVTRQVGHIPGQLAAGLPGTADGTYADIGAALEKAIAVLDRPGAPPLATVLLVTGGRHRPGPGSAYPAVPGPRWTVLTERAARLDKTFLQAYAVPLSAQPGAGVLRRVFPQAQVLAPVAADRLAGQLAGPREATRIAKARSLLAEEVTLPVTVSWPLTAGGAGRTGASVRVESRMPHVPLVLENLVVSSDNPDVSVTVPAEPVVLPPGREITVPLTVDWNAGPVSVAPLRTVEDRAALRLTATVSSPWTPVLTGDLGLTPRFTLAGTAGERELSAQRGSLWRWLGALFLLVVALLVGLRIRWVRAVAARRRAA
ncbi:MAG TPA: vWA domain-containing protein [Actinoplanes sp.]|nr:vWA domain-containing protein [Actinoplanes sp.]